MVVIKDTDKLKAIIKDICHWNAERHDRESNEELTNKLLTEEANEYSEAVYPVDEVEQADALGDIFYVAIGGLWKKGEDPEQIYTYVDTEGLALHEDADIPVIFSLVSLHAKLRNAAIASLHYLIKKYDEKTALNIIAAICKSNNTKKVEKVAAHIKANLDKGENYIPPTRDIKMYIENFNKGK